MLTKFSVQGFRGFDKPFVFDFNSTKNYTFNPECLQDNVIKNAIVYGVNGCGKSNLGLALIDLTHHLHEHTKANESLEGNYLNGHLNEGHCAHFKYEFQLNGHQIRYHYGKKQYQATIYEQFWIDEQLLLDVDQQQNRLALNFGDGEFINGFANALHGNLSSVPSVVKMLRMMLLLQQVDTTRYATIIQDFLKFVDGMVSIRTLMQHADYSGLQHINANRVAEFIIKNNKIKTFEAFLQEAGIDCCLEKETALNGQEQLVFQYDQKAIAFSQVASTGTLSLGVLYYWFLQLEANAYTFVYLDEFDAYYHHELAITMVRRMKQLNQQVVLSTHNTTIMSNDLLRPDCYFIFDQAEMKPLHQLIAKKEIRKAHNLEKIYKGLTDGIHINQ